MSSFTPFYEEKPANPEPKTGAGGDHPGETNFSSEPQIPKKNPLGQPKNSVFKRMSALARFRHSPLYQRLKDKLAKQDTMTQSDDSFTPANLKERAEAMVEFVAAGGKVDNLFRYANDHKLIVEDEKDFADSVIAILIDAGFDENLVEVEVEGGGSVMVYVDERATAKHKNIRDLLSEIANVELIARPDDNPELGTFIYKITANSETSDRATNLIPDLQATSKQESKKGEDDLNAPKKNCDGVGPQADTKDKKGRRVMHDRNRSETFTPRTESKKMRFTAFTPHVEEGELEEALGTNPIPREGDVIIDSRARKHFEVKRILTNDKCEVQGTDGTAGIPSPEDRFIGSPTVMSMDKIRRGLTSGTMSRIRVQESEDSFASYLHTCPNCVIPLVQEEDSFVCGSCEFIAEFADELPE